MSNRTLGRAPALAAPGRSAGRQPPTPADRRSLGSPSAASRPFARSVVTVAPGAPPEHLFRSLLSAYLGGATDFEVRERRGLSPTTREIVREFCRRTSGPQLVRAAPDALELVDLDPQGAPPLDVRLGQLGEKVLSFHRESAESWTLLPFGDERFWERRDDEVDREAWAVEREVSRLDRAPARARGETAALWTVARSLERIADHAVTLGEVGPRLADLGADGGLLRELRQFHRQAMDHLEAVLRGSDADRTNDLLDVGEALAAGGRTLAERLLPAVEGRAMSPASAAAVARAVEAISRTIAYSQDIAQAYFDRATVRARGAGGLPAGARSAAP